MGMREKNMGPPTEENLVEFYRKNFERIKQHIIKNKGNKKDAEDIFQNALLAVLIRFKNDPPNISISFERYFFGVCKNMWRRELHKSKKWGTKPNSVEHVDEASNIALAIVEQKRYELFLEKLQQLNDNCREIMELFFSKMTYSDIKRKLSYKNENVVKQRVFKCKQKLIKLIKEDPEYQMLKKL